ncbi:MAG: hypothetical protein EP330_26185 [Deltaproteobacteria bacterium]|nr:MAG: hypothetical protein EP330_26185 [Deltaproteobacteria bacterium]
MRLVSLLALAACTGTADDALDTGPLPLVAPTLAETLDVNGVVTTKGLGVDALGDVWLWNYNQDQLEVWRDGALTVVGSGLVTSFGTDLAVDDSGDIYVSKGDSGEANLVMKWSADGGTPWGSTGQVVDGALVTGLHAADWGGEPALFVADALGGQILVLDPSTGGRRAAIAVADLPLDVAVWQDRLFVLTSLSTDPLGDGHPSTLRALDSDGTELATTELVGGSYLAIRDGHVAVSVNDFSAEVRSLRVYAADLSEHVEVDFPAAYVGFAGGIDVRDGRIYVSAQAGTGSDPICDVLVFE